MGSARYLMSGQRASIRMREERERSIHDNFVYGYAVACEQRQIVLHTEFRDGGAEEFTDVIFSGVVAHHFQDVLTGNILFGIEESDLEQVVQAWGELFAEGKRHGWPDVIEYDAPAHLVAILRERGVKAFEISSSFGLRGFVLGTAMEQRPRDSKASLI
jgi:hypothetical protein